MIIEIEKELNEKRDEVEVVFKRWYFNVVEFSLDLGIEFSVLRIVLR